MASTASGDYPRPIDPEPAVPAFFDIVVTTLGRSVEVERLLSSIAAQSLRSFRVIIVDQNPDDRLHAILQRFEGQFALLHLTSGPGASRGRNVGLTHVTGDAVAFPDDDCWYAPDLLAQIDELLNSHPDWDGLTGRVIDEVGRPSGARWRKKGGPVDRLHVWTQGVALSIFVRRRLVEGVGPFDETIGTGSDTGLGAGEETDFLLAALEHGYRVEYVPSVTVFHPQVRVAHDEQTISKGRLYGAGMGRVLRKHRYPWWFFGYQTFRSVGGSVLALVKGKVPEARFHLAVARGRLRGWRWKPPR